MTEREEMIPSDSIAPFRLVINPNPLFLQAFHLLLHQHRNHPLSVLSSAVVQKVCAFLLLSPVSEEREG